MTTITFKNLEEFKEYFKKPPKPIITYFTKAEKKELIRLGYWDSKTMRAYERL